MNTLCHISMIPLLKVTYTCTSQTTQIENVKMYIEPRTTIPDNLARFGENHKNVRCNLYNFE